MVPLSLLILIILSSWLRVARPGGQRLTGQQIHDAPLPLLARLRMHLVPMLVIGTFALPAWLFWTLPLWGVALAIGSLALLIAVPVRYTLTTTGIRCGWTPARRWTEFAGVSRAPWGARLQGAAGSRDMRIWLSGTLGDDEFVLLLRRMITGAYKGRNLLVEYPPPPVSNQRPGRQAASVEVRKNAI